MDLDKYDISRPAIKVFKNGEKRGMRTVETRFRHFSDECEFLHSNHPKTTFDKDSKGFAKHLGQLKLFLTNLQFVTKYWDIVQHPDPILLYIGAAPCSWGLLFMKYFPEFELHLYDPDKFAPKLLKKSKEGGKLFIYNQLFAEEDVKRWESMERNIFFVSDIRLRNYNKLGENAQKDVHDCMMMQEDWVKRINPLYAQLKFKLPYEGFNCDNYVYLDGKIYFQAWVGPLSSEARLVSSRPHTKTSYICKEYEEMMFNHNTTTRKSGNYFRNVLDDSPSFYHLLPRIGLNNEWDSTLTVKIIKEYLEKTLPTEQKVTEQMVYDFFSIVSEQLVQLKSL